MGLRMSKWWRALAASVLAFSVGASCMKKPNLNDNDGPQASAEQVQNALLAAWGDGDASNIRLNEFSYSEKEVALSDLPSQVVLQDSKTVARLDDPPEDPSLRIVRILHQIKEFTADNQEKLSTREDELRVNRPSSAAVEGFAALGKDLQAQSTDAFLPYPEDLVVESMAHCALSGPSFKVSCHNLKTWDTLEDAPPLVRQRQGCEGLTNCKIRKKVVSYDMIVDFTDNETNSKVRQKLIYTVKISPDVPHLSRVTDYCYQGLGSHQGQKFPATFCQTVKNFIRGDP